MDEKIKKKPIKSLKLEMWGRKWNLVLRDIPGKLDETPKRTGFRCVSKCEWEN
jgi:hypothetical protein